MSDFVYALPDEPDHPVIDREGDRWVRCGDGYWSLGDGGAGGSHLWYELLGSFGPLCPAPREFKVGDVARREDLHLLPALSIFATKDQYPYVAVPAGGGIRKAGTGEWLAFDDLPDREYVILRVGSEYSDRLNSLARKECEIITTAPKATKVTEGS